MFPRRERSAHTREAFPNAMKSPAIGVGKETSDSENEMHQERKLSKAGAQRCNPRCKDVITVSVTLLTSRPT